MRRLFVILVALALVGIPSACSSKQETDYSNLDRPIVLGAEPASGPINDTTGIEGSIKLNFIKDDVETFNEIDGGFRVDTCSKMNGGIMYGITVVFETEVKEPGKIHLSYGLKTSQDEDYHWSTQPTNINVEQVHKVFMFSFTIAARSEDDIYLKLVAVGGDSSGDHSSRHYDEYTPGPEYGPVINHEFCSARA